MQVVIDTNIIISALLTPDGYSAIFMDKVFGDHYDVVVTETILSEYEEVLSREQFGIEKSTIEYIINWFRKFAYIVEVNEEDYPKDEMPDSKDAPFYVAARATKSRLVTGNIRHYPVEEMRTMLWEII